MRLEAPRNEDALIALGVAQFKAMAITHEYATAKNADGEDVVTVGSDGRPIVAAYVVPDNLDLSGYAAAVATLSAPTVPVSISDRQFAQALADAGTITQIEALDFVKTGTLPKALQDAVDTIPDSAQKFATEMLLSGATTFERNHPEVAVLGAALDKSSADLDAIWIAGAKL